MHLQRCTNNFLDNFERRQVSRNSRNFSIFFLFVIMKAFSFDCTEVIGPETIVQVTDAAVRNVS